MSMSLQLLQPGSLDQVLVFSFWYRRRQHTNLPLILPTVTSAPPQVRDLWSPDQVQYVFSISTWCHKYWKTSFKKEISISEATRQTKDDIIQLQELARKSTIFPNTKKPHLTTSITSLTNFPEPCQVCKLNECRYDLAHELAFTISGAVETALEKLNCNGELEKVFGELNWKAKPPDET